MAKKRSKKSKRGVAGDKIKSTNAVGSEKILRSKSADESSLSLVVPAAAVSIGNIASDKAVNSENALHSGLSLVIFAASISIEPRSIPIKPVLQVPAWFLEHRVKLAETLKEQGAVVRIRSTEPDYQVSSTACQLDDLYEIDDVVYDPIRGILRSDKAEIGADESIFKYDTAYLRHNCSESSALCVEETKEFLKALVEQFSAECCSDLVSLSLEDLRDLAAHFASLQAVQHKGSTLEYELVKRYFSSEDEDVPEKTNHPYSIGGESAVSENC